MEYKLYWPDNLRPGKLIEYDIRATDCVQCKHGLGLENILKMLARKTVDIHEIMPF